MKAEVSKEFCHLLDEWRHQNLFCDAYLVGDDGVLVPIHKAVIASKAYLLLNDLNEKEQSLHSIFGEELVNGNHLEKSFFNVKGYNRHIINTFVRIIYIQDFSIINTIDMKLQLCYFLLQIAKLLNINDDYISKSFDKFQRKTARFVNNSAQLRDDICRLGKYQGKTVYTCLYCKREFFSKPLLNCHLKLHLTLRTLTRSIPIENSESIKSKQTLLITSGSRKTYDGHCMISNSEEVLCQNRQSDELITGQRKSRIGNMCNSDFLCLQCGKKFTTCSNLRRHQETVHRGIKRFSCPLCISRFGQKVTLQLHLATVHKVIQGSSTVLGEDNDISEEPELIHTISSGADISFSKSIQFDLFSIFVNSDNEDIQDGEKITSLEDIAMPTVELIDRNTWQEKTTCKICNKQFSRPSNLKKHLLIHNATNKISSDLTEVGPCPSVPSSGRQLPLRNSLDTVSNEIKCKRMGGNFVCHHCGKKFLLAEYLKRHISVIHCSTRKFSCPKCTKKFASKTRLKRHEVVHESRKCDRCSKILVGPRAFKNHLRTYCELPSFPIQEDTSFLFGDPSIANISFDMLTTRTM